MKETINKDTYQTLKELKIQPPPYEKSITPMWKEEVETVKPYSLYVATPVHSNVSIHYTQALLELQQLCMKKKIRITFSLLKSSLVTQGRNLCVSGFLASDFTHLLFVDSDIYMEPESILTMIEKDKDVISIPCPLKTMMWDKLYKRMENGEIKGPGDIPKNLNCYPMRVANAKDIQIEDGVMEVTHSPTGCMLIKRGVFDKMIKAYPNHNIVQKTVINGKYIDRPHLWNFFDTLHDPDTKSYLGEDFAFCKRWKDIGGKCYTYVNDSIVHVGEHQYEGRFADELKPR